MSFPDEDAFLENFHDRSDIEQDNQPNSLLRSFPTAVEISQRSDEGTPSVTSSDEDEQESRERFKGSSQHWQWNTRSERDLAKSLDSLDAENLSIHLFNAHAWKKRVRKQSQNKKHSLLPKQNQVASSSEWVPPRHWTSWPMRVQHVPRSWERFMHYYDDVDVPGEVFKYRNTMREKPSRPLEDSLLSEMLKQARQGFQVRQLQDQHREESQEPQPKRRKLDPKENIQMDSIHQKDSTKKFSLTEKERAPANRDDSAEDGAESNTAEYQPTTQDAAESIAEESSDRDYKPVVMADEETARTIALPSLRHTLSKLDGLLMVLHHSRRYLSKAKSYKPEAVGAKTNGKSRPNRQTKQSNRPPLRYNPRDWSEVLNAAALAGWDQEVIERCADRCSALFGQSMSFRTLEEQQELFDKSMADRPSSETQPQPREASHTSEDSASESTQSPYIDRLKYQAQNWEQNDRASSHPLYDPKLLMCLIPSCTKYMKNFRTPRQLHQHLSNMHNWRVQAVELMLQENSTPYDGGSDDEMYGGVHVDGFLKPVRMRSKWAVEKYIHRPRKPNDQEVPTEQALGVQSDPSPASESEV